MNLRRRWVGRRASLCETRKIPNYFRAEVSGQMPGCGWKVVVLPSLKTRYTRLRGCKWKVVKTPVWYHRSTFLMFRLQPDSLLRRNTIFRNYLAANTISQIGSSIFDLAIPLYVLQRTEVMGLSLVAACLFLPHFLMAPLTGFSADNFNKRNVMIFSDIGQVACMLYLLVYDFGSTRVLWPILLTVFIAKSLMLMFETVATFQLIPSLVTAEDLPAANTWFLSMHRLVQIVGPFLGGALFGLLGIRSCIIVNTISFGATLFFTYKLKNLDRIIQGNADAPPLLPLTIPNIARSFRESLVYVWRAPLFRPFIFLMFLWNFSSLTLNSPTLIYYFTAAHHYSAENYGLMASMFGFFGIIGFIISSVFYRRYAFPRAFAGSCLAQAIFAGAAVLCASFPLMLALLYSFSRAAGSSAQHGNLLPAPIQNSETSDRGRECLPENVLHVRSPPIRPPARPSDQDLRSGHLAGGGGGLLVGSLLVLSRSRSRVDSPEPSSGVANRAA